MKNLPALLYWIEQHLDQKLTPTQIANVVGCTPRHLFTLFKRMTGHSPAAHIRLRKLTLAGNMLRLTSRPVTDIANMYAFSTVQAFTRTFRQHFGLSPRTYREAEQWDMSKNHHCNIVTSPLPYWYKTVQVRDVTLLVEKTDIRQLSYGFNFLLMMENDRIVTMRDIQNYYARLLTMHAASQSRQFTVLWDMDTNKPGHDAEIHAHTGTLNNRREKRDVTIPLPSGDYARFSVSGTFQEIVAFMAWSRGYGLHQHRCIMKRGPTFTCIIPSLAPEQHRIKHYIPVDIPDAGAAILY